MARIGLSKPYYAKYNETGGVVTYSDGGLLGKAVEVSITPNKPSENKLYADNDVCETESGISDGDLSVTTDDIEQTTLAAILGITESTIEVGSASIKELIYDNAMNPPYLGFGVVFKRQKNNVVKYQAIVLNKVKFDVPSDTGTTQGESIAWQTRPLTGKFLKDTRQNGRASRSAFCETEDEAEAYIKQILSIDQTSGT